MDPSTEQFIKDMEALEHKTNHEAVDLGLACLGRALGHVITVLVNSNLDIEAASLQILLVLQENVLSVSEIMEKDHEATIDKHRR